MTTSDYNKPGEFDGIGEIAMKLINQIPPDICRGCKHLSSDNLTEYHPPSYYCERHLMWPTKGACKKREEYV